MADNGNSKIIRPDTAGAPVEYFELSPYPATYSGSPFGPRKHLRRYLRQIQRRKWVILAFIFASALISIAHTTRQTPIYKATARLEIDQESNNVLPYQDFNSTQTYNYFYEEFLQTQIKHITSRTLAARVVEVEELDRAETAVGQQEIERNRLSALWARITGQTVKKEKAYIAPSRENIREQAIDRILAGLSVMPIKDSRVVEISYTSPDPEEAARMANTITDQYIDYNFQAKYDATSRATDFLQKQLVDLKSKVEKQEADVIKYARDHNILNVSEKKDVVHQALGDISTQLTEARSIRMDKESVYLTLAKAKPEDFPQALRTPIIEKLQSSLFSDEQELAQLSSQLGPSMPQVKKLKSKIQATLQQLAREQQLAIDNAYKEYETALAREKLLSGAFEKQKILANNLNESSISYNILQREAETTKQLYDGLLQRLKEAGVAAGLKSSNIRVVDKAKVPKAPFNPDMRKNLAIALMLGLMGGLGLAFFLNYLDNTVKTPEDVEEMIGLPSLGLIPSLQSARSRYGYRPSDRKRKTYFNALTKQGVELATLVAGSSLIAESYRAVRTALLLSSPENPPKIITVTSARAGEGKTTTVCNMALSLAQTGKSVLILDCDMRRPKVKKIFKEKGAGLGEYLTGQVGFSDVIRETTIPNLSIVHSGTLAPNPGELLGSLRMQNAIEASSGVFDYILIDTPPLMTVTDPLIVAPMTDGVILVTKGSKNPPEILKKAKKNLEMVHARILGVLCNDVDLHSSDFTYYYHQYAEYASYLPDEEPGSARPTAS
jgi:succinoglycan biosynthesis transport protein ExoP